MTDHWIIYRKGKTLGPWTTLQVRHGLMMGTVTPQDLASGSGSPIRNEIVEIEELRELPPGLAALFSLESRGGFGDTTAEQGGTVVSEATPSGTVRPGTAAPGTAVPGTTPPGAAVPDGANETTPSPDSGHEYPTKQPPHSRRPNQRRSSDPRDRQMQAAARSLAAAKARQDAKAKQRKYFIIDRRKRIVGPVSASEIVKMSGRGLLGAGVQVQKTGGLSAIPIDVFLKAYAADKRSGDGRGQGFSPVQKAGLGATGIRMIRASQNLARTSIAMMGGMVLVLALGVGYVYKESVGKELSAKAWLNQVLGREEPDSGRRRVEGRARAGRPKMRLQPSRASRSKKAKKGGAAKEASERAKPGKTVEKTIEKTIEKTKPASPPKPVPESERAPGKAPGKAPARPLKRASKPQTPAPRRRISAPKTYQGPHRGSRRRPQVRIAPRPVPAPAAKSPAPNAFRARSYSAPAPKPAPKPAQSPIAVAVSKGAAVATIGPLSASPSALSACQVKCSVPLRDASGRSITAIFFRQSPFFATFKSKSSGLYVTGRLSGGGSSIFVQSAR